MPWVHQSPEYRSPMQMMARLHPSSRWPATVLSLLQISKSMNTPPSDLNYASVPVPLKHLKIFEFFCNAPNRGFSYWYCSNTQVTDQDWFITLN